MNIPKGYKLVPVETTEEMNESGCQGYMAADGSAWVMHKSSMEAAYKAMLAAAPTPPQPIYDEAKELESCRSSWEKTGVGVVFADYWQGWLACAQSRAKAGEDE